MRNSPDWMIHVHRVITFCVHKRLCLSISFTYFTWRNSLSKLRVSREFYWNIGDPEIAFEKCIWSLQLGHHTYRVCKSLVPISFFYLILRTILSHIAYIEGRTKRRLKMKDTTKMDFFVISWRLRHSLLIINALHTSIRNHSTHVPKNSLNMNVFTRVSETGDKLPTNGLLYKYQVKNTFNFREITLSRAN